ncbi:hypothetical protein APHMUC_0908 [Anaplasma phagocytophilum str. ApMUC09]|uniref:Uncharacterized protein n=1 Tax=Anaplasma phagocytophilum str. ApMUC09 TaxID=1359152 RepID=A0A0F3N9F9_ANAPH|nr:hypothetical protein APHMUC_0908 [Anaplasma phagocytophilum str. ApMUC09]
METTSGENAFVCYNSLYECDTLHTTISDVMQNIAKHYL